MDEKLESKPSTYVYSDPVNGFLGNFLPSGESVSASSLDQIDWTTPKATGLEIRQLADRIEAKLSMSEWFVTGMVDPSLFAKEFSFKDDSVATKGIRSYAEGVRKIFDQETSRAEVVSVDTDAAKGIIVVTWRLEGCVNLPFKPRITPYVVTTTFEVDSDGLISSQLDEFSVPGWRLLAGALLGSWAGPTPALPVVELRKSRRIT
ncbi:hypothetical protein CEUSTIGMA_g2249.t1 [Chlamydomonas eustigma]|uniref:Uncharacterized protein n=1 Tax=Chlamydomonas eustigma TaxID=1157962 RepID=A0A250WW06_9CHLO|nr:hypothetical protein CEUSTIGMA_g2249.t1 [Chlamydomonas eustigma]|eukprot:GAX74802.1 hypothetical protein CEUSTIGMA_g2249.t1 [Chlamydomonas eustigma]